MSQQVGDDDEDEKEKVFKKGIENEIKNFLIYDSNF